jgi:hypothetical protein
MNIVHLVRTRKLIIIKQAEKALVHVRGLHGHGVVEYVFQVIHRLDIQCIKKELVRGKPLSQRSDSFKQLHAGAVEAVLTHEIARHTRTLWLEQRETHESRICLRCRKHIILRRRRDHRSNKGSGHSIVVVLGRALGGPRSLATNVADQVVLTTNELRMMENTFLIDAVGASKTVQVELTLNGCHVPI